MAQAKFFDDTFTEGSNTLLSAHTPDTGTSWTRIQQNTTTNDIHVLASVDNAQPDGTDLTGGVVYSADATYPSADYQVELTIPTVATISGRRLSVGLRMDSAGDNGYIIEAVNNNSTAADPTIYEYTAASATSLAFHDNSNWTLFSNGDTVVAEIVGDTIIFFDVNEIGQLYVVDTTHTLARQAAMGWGAWVNGSDDLDPAMDVDDFAVWELGNTVEGWNNPSTTGENNNDFTSPTNAYTSNDVDATAGTIGNLQDYGDFGFSVPAGATVRGIEVRVEADLDSTGHFHVGVEVSNDNGATWSAQKLIQMEQNQQGGAGDVVKVAGHARSLWGLTWTPTDLDDTDFRVRIEFQAKEAGAARTLELDHVSARVFYDTAAGGPSDTVVMNSGMIF